MDSLEIGKVLNNFLLNDTNVTKLIGSKILPIVADQGTTYPFVCYKRSNLELSNSKDRFNTRETAYITFIVATRNYRESVDIAKAIKHSLDHKRGELDGIKINEIELTSASEDYVTDSDAFVQYLNFKIDIIK